MMSFSIAKYHKRGGIYQIYDTFFHALVLSVTGEALTKGMKTEIRRKSHMKNSKNFTNTVIIHKTIPIFL